MGILLKVFEIRSSYSKNKFKYTLQGEEGVLGGGGDIKEKYTLLYMKTIFLNELQFS